MATKNRVFPYPFYSPSSGDYENPVFDAVWSLEKDEQNLTLKGYFKIGNLHINELIVDGAFAITALITCTNTAFRSSFSTNSDSVEIDIPLCQLDGVVQISTYITSSSVQTYVPQGCDPFFSNCKYEIEKGNILGESPAYTFEVSHKETKSPLGIFTRSFNGDMSDADPIRVMYRTESINLEMSKNIYDLIERMENKPSYYSLIHTTYILPVLTQTIVLMLCNDGENNNNEFRNQHCEDKWFSVLDDKIAEEGPKNQLDAFVIAQKLLGRPINDLAAKELRKKKESTSVNKMEANQHE